MSSSSDEPEGTNISKAVAVSNTELTSNKWLLNLVDNFFPGGSFLFIILQRYLKKSHSSFTQTATLSLLLGVFWFRRSVYGFLKRLVQDHFMSRACMRDGDYTFHMLLRWLEKQSFAKQSHIFEVTWDNLQYLKYSPTTGSYPFWHQGRLFFLKRGSDRKTETLTLSTFGRNPNKLKSLLELTTRDFFLVEEAKTTIYVERKSAWSRGMTRISRKFSTIVLEDEVKKSVIKDMAEYLNIDQQRWYNNRGIPYRRGYLMSGPPGTGKSSFSFALAGYFELPIYVLSLNSSSMTDSLLETLFGALPAKCVALLEDVDATGFTHKRTSATTEKSDEKKDKKSDEGKLSLSALLNAIDGVASKEGRILIMTTNHVENLDPALIRPGRVDKIIKFGLATEAQIAQIFNSIYTPMEGDARVIQERDAQAIRESNAYKERNPESTFTASYEQVGFAPIPTISPSKSAEEQAREADAAEANKIKISELGKKFASIIPSGEFSPAEIQGYLINWKHDPELAVKNAAAWASETKAEKVAENIVKLKTTLTEKHETEMEGFKGLLSEMNGQVPISDAALDKANMVLKGELARLNSTKSENRVHIETNKESGKETSKESCEEINKEINEVTTNENTLTHPATTPEAKLSSIIRKIESAEISDSDKSTAIVEAKLIVKTYQKNAKATYLKALDVLVPEKSKTADSETVVSTASNKEESNSGADTESGAKSDA